MSSPFSLCTWNILATSYIRPEYYPNTPPAILDPGWRLPALVRRARELQADILCLQEVEAASFATLRSGLEPQGYAGRLAMKGGRKPDGCATFFRTDLCQLLDERRLLYSDSATGPNSGHVAQVLSLQMNGTLLTLVNTHLKWDSSGTPRDRQWGYRQIEEAISTLPANDPGAVEIICGDLNVQADSPVVRLLNSAGFHATHLPGPGVYSCNSSGEPKLIDYILFRGGVRAEPVPLPSIDGDTPLPSADQPSDHLPLVARFVPDLPTA